MNELPHLQLIYRLLATCLDTLKILLLLLRTTGWPRLFIILSQGRADTQTESHCNYQDFNGRRDLTLQDGSRLYSILPPHLVMLYTGGSPALPPPFKLPFFLSLFFPGGFCGGGSSLPVTNHLSISALTRSGCLTPGRLERCEATEVK